MAATNRTEAWIILHEQGMLRSGEGKAEAERLFDEHKVLVFSFLRCRLRHEQDAEDATVETFHRVIRHYDKFRGDCSERAWVMQVARNVSLRYGERALKNRDRISDDPTFETADTGIDLSCQATDRALVQHLLERLPEERRDAVWLRVGQGFTDPEVAQILGVPVGTVKAWVWRSLASLRKSMMEEVVT